MSEKWFVLSDSAKWWDKYSENYYQKYWNISSSKWFKEIAQLVFYFFFNCRMSKNDLKMMKKFKKFWNMHEWNDCKNNY